MAIGVTKNLTNWEFQSNYVERQMDNAAYEAAHPDDTLVLAGPARKHTLDYKATEGLPSMMAIGMLQSMQFTQTRPTQPMMAIGSGRSFFVSGKSQTQWVIARLFVNGRNLLRILHNNALQSGIDVSKFDDPAAKAQYSNYFINLDSEVYYIPFGLGAIFRNKAHALVGAFYAELCMINSYAVGMAAGQNMVLENVSGLADRMLPFEPKSAMATRAGGIPKATMDAVLGFTGDYTPERPGMGGNIGGA